MSRTVYCYNSNKKIMFFAAIFLSNVNALNCYKTLGSDVTPIASSLFTTCVKYLYNQTIYYDGTGETIAAPPGYLNNPDSVSCITDLCNTVDLSFPNAQPLTCYTDSGPMQSSLFTTCVVYTQNNEKYYVGINNVGLSALRSSLSVSQVTTCNTDLCNQKQYEFSTFLITVIFSTVFGVGALLGKFLHLFIFCLGIGATVLYVQRKQKKPVHFDEAVLKKNTKPNMIVVNTSDYKQSGSPTSYSPVRTSPRRRSVSRV